MKLFFDTEFTGLTQDTSLISLAIVDEAGRTFYAEFTDFNRDQVDAFLSKNVFKNLILAEDGKSVVDKTTYCKGDSAAVTAELLRWLEYYQPGKVQFVADVLMYDWVLFAQLFGGALKIPPFVHYMPIDFATLLYASGQPMQTKRIELLDERELATLNEICPTSSLHNALYDAHLLKMCFEKLEIATAG